MQDIDEDIVYEGHDAEQNELTVAIKFAKKLSGNYNSIEILVL